MSIDSAFYPCAGLGTRMGELGKVVPKPLWPIFETTLLELQVLYATSLGLRHHHINTHHLEHVFTYYLDRQKSQIVRHHEPFLLGSGGCFHNLIKQGLKDNLYIFNPDSFLLLSDNDWKLFFSMASRADQVLIAVPCNKEDHYNRFKVEDGVLKEIVPPNNFAPRVTYSGFGKVNLSTLSFKAGESSFFESVARVGQDDLWIFEPNDPFEYWDFGTLDLYKRNIMKLLKENSKLKNFLLQNKVIDQSFVNEDSYKSNQVGIINFSSEEKVSSQKGIYISTLEYNSKLVRV